MLLFTKETFEFLFQNRMHDSKPWFEEHRADYEKYVLQPFQQLVQEMAPAMLEIDGQLIVEPRVDRTISRIRRDTRFTKDKSLYRDVMWCSFLRDKKQWGGCPGFVMELSPAGWRCGCGFYQTQPAVMQRLRDLVIQNNRYFLRALDTYQDQQLFRLEGERYKRSKFPDKPPHLREWLDRKSIWVCHNSEDFSLLCSDGLAQTLIGYFQGLVPIYEFFWLAQSSAVRPLETQRPAALV